MFLFFIPIILSNNQLTGAGTRDIYLSRKHFLYWNIFDEDKIWQFWRLSRWQYSFLMIELKEFGDGDWIVDTDSSDGLLIRFDKPIDKPTDPIWSLNIIPYAYNLKFVKNSF